MVSSLKTKNSEEDFANETQHFDFVHALQTTELSNGSY
jgi:hypothetical protein